MPRDWRGDIVFSDHLAIFRGHVGDNKPHCHWASQITIALDGQLEFEASTGVQRADAVYFASKTTHRLISGFVCSIYFDPLSTSIYKALKTDAPAGWAAMSSAELPDELRSITADTPLPTLLESEALGLSSFADERIGRVTQALKAGLAQGQDLDRDALAGLANLSPSRFSHWFVEQTGVPLRSFKKWLKLRLAMDALIDGKGLTEAAMTGGFSDIAHLSREFSDSLGLTYLDAKKAWELSQQD